MFVCPKELVEAPSKRRGDIEGSTGLDYSTCHRVEDDILTLIRSLFASQPSHSPARTLLLEEISAIHQNQSSVGAFDFTTAKSVAHLARVAQRMSSTPNMEVCQPLSQPEKHFANFGKRGALRRSSSLNSIEASDRAQSRNFAIDMEEGLDGAVINDSLLPCCSRPPQQKEFELPRLVSRNKDYLLAKVQAPTTPAMTRESTVRPIDESSAQDAESIHPPQSSIHNGVGLVLGIPELGWKYEEASKPHNDVKSRMTPIPSFGFQLNDPKINSLQLISERTQDLRETPEVQSSSSGPRSKIAHGPEPSQILGKVSGHSAPTPSLRCDTSTVDQIDNPDLDDDRSEAGRLSPPGSTTTIPHYDSITEMNSGLPSSVPGPWSSSNSLPLSTETTPSLSSGASKNSAYRHVLLKPSVATHTIDLGLPIPPIITPLVVNMESGAHLDTGITADKVHKQVSPISSIITQHGPPIYKEESAPRNLIQPRPSLSNIKSIPKEDGHDALIGELATITEKPVDVSLHISDATNTIVGNITGKDEAIVAEPAGKLATEAAREAVGIRGCSAPMEVTSLSQTMVGVDPGSERGVRCESTTEKNIPHQRFVPSITETKVPVSDAVESAVHDINTPVDLRSDQASGASHIAVTESLEDVAQTADEYLRRYSLCHNRSKTVHQATDGSHSLAYSQQKKSDEPWNAGSLSPDPNSFFENTDTSPQLPSISKKATSPTNTSIPAHNRSPPLYSLEKVIRSNIPRPSSDSSSVGTDSNKPEKQGGSSPSMKIMAPGRSSESKPARHKYSESDQTAWSSAHQEKTIDSGGASSVYSRQSSLDKLGHSYNSPRHLEGEVASAKDTESREYVLDEVSQQPDSMHSENIILTALPSRKVAAKIYTIDAAPNLAETDGSEPAATNKHDPYRTVYWAQGLPSNTQSYLSRLTSFLPRKQFQLDPPIRIDQDTSGLCDPVDQSCLETATKTKVRLKETQALRASEAFTRTINDLENLLDEALNIARQAAEKEEAIHTPPFFEDSPALLQKHDSGARSDSMNTDIDYARMRRPSGQSVSSRESVHESILSYSVRSSSSIREMDRVGSHDTHYEKETGSRGYPVGHEAPVQKTVMMTRNPATWLRLKQCPASPHMAGPIPPTFVLRNEVRAGQVPKQAPSDKINPGYSHMPTITKSSTSLGPSRLSDLPVIREGNAHPNTYRPDGTNCFSSRAGELSGQLYGITPIERLGKILDVSPNTASPVQLGKDLRKPGTIQKVYEEDDPHIIRAKSMGQSIPNKREVQEFIRVFHQPPIQPRGSSLILRKPENSDRSLDSITSAIDFLPRGMDHGHTPCSACSIDGPHDSDSEIDFSDPRALQRRAANTRENTQAAGEGGNFVLKDVKETKLPRRHISGRRLQDQLHDKAHRFNLRGKSHISLSSHQHFSLSRSHHRQPIARDWSSGRKRFVAAVTCISTALIGILIGIYAGEVPSIQYYIADFSHWSLLGNVFMFIGLAISNFLFWPLPLLFGRKPYILIAMTIAMPLLFPQAVVVGLQRSPYVVRFRVGLILPRAIMGFALGFANMNFMATLTDLFGASLQSSNPHQEVVDEFDVRRHGGGMGVWLGIWTWCYMGSIGVGFFIGAVIINTLSPDWGFYVSIVIIAAVIFLNVLTPEVRRSPYRRSVTEVRKENNVSRRLARGEIKMHRVQTGPVWWGEEFYHGILLSLDMLRQPGFLLMAFYVAWIYGQIVLVIVVSL